MPFEAELEQYNTSYFRNAHGGANLAKSAFFSGMARLRLAHLKQYLDDHRVVAQRVTEWGPGAGYFARHWLDAYLTTEYRAVETDVSCHSLLIDSGVRLCSAAEVAAEQIPTDLVVMSHVLEHVPQPVSFLADATRGLRKGGAIFIEVPCRDWQHKALDEPHLLFFDKNPLHELLSSIGFDHIRLSYHGQTLEQLASASAMYSTWLAVRSKLIGLGLVAPFSRIRPGMETMPDPVERGMVAPFNAHVESLRPAWWLRAVALKS